MKKSGLIDFPAVKDAVSMEVVLNHYGIELPNPERVQQKVLCPFHRDRNPSCEVNTTKKVFQCFSCKAKGNVFDFIAIKEGYGNNSTYKAAVQAIKIMGADPNDFRVADVSAKSTRKSASAPTAKPPMPMSAVQPKAKTPSAEDLPDHNPVLDLELTLDETHPFLLARNIPEMVAASFGIGFCNKGIMKGRIAIPIHNFDGDLVAFIGRHPADDVPENVPKYKFPKGFQKNLELYNIHRARNLRKRYVVVVEGFWSAIHLHLAGIPTVALMGTSISDQQAQLVTAAGFDHAMVIFDGDDPGREATAAAVSTLSQHVYAKSIGLPDDTSPDEMVDELVNRLRR